MEPSWNNSKYLEIRRANNIPCESERQNKHLKNLFQSYISELKFTARPDKRKSDVIQHETGLD